MNKLIKIIIATLGAIDLAFQIFIPISIALLIATISKGDTTLIIIIGILASLYRAIIILPWVRENE